MEYMGNQQYWDQKFCLRTGQLPPEQLLTEELSLFTGKHGAGSCLWRRKKCTVPCGTGFSGHGGGFQFVRFGTSERLCSTGGTAYLHKTDGSVLSRRFGAAGKVRRDFVQPLSAVIQNSRTAEGTSGAGWNFVDQWFCRVSAGQSFHTATGSDRPAGLPGCRIPAAFYKGVSGG